MGTGTDRVTRAAAAQASGLPPGRSRWATRTGPCAGTPRTCCTDRLSGLPSAERDEDEDEDAKRFDLRILRAQLCVLTHESGLDSVAERVREIAHALLEQISIPATREQEVFLDALTDQKWWADVAVPMLEEVRRRVRSLVRLIERVKRRTVYTEFHRRVR